MLIYTVDSTLIPFQHQPKQVINVINVTPLHSRCFMDLSDQDFSLARIAWHYSTPLP